MAARISRQSNPELRHCYRGWPLACGTLEHGRAYAADSPPVRPITPPPAPFHRWCQRGRPSPKYRDYRSAQIRNQGVGVRGVAPTVVLITRPRCPLYNPPTTLTSSPSWSPRTMLQNRPVPSVRDSGLQTFWAAPSSVRFLHCKVWASSIVRGEVHSRTPPC